MIGTVEELLAEGGSVSLYMAHGGTNFGLWAGANHDGVLQPTVTSYDSDAPIGEDGTLNEKFHALRAAFAPFHAGDLPPIPGPPRRQSAASAPLAVRASLLDVVRAAPASITAPQPLTFEALGAEDGLVAYEARVDYAPGAELAVDVLHDRAVVFLDGVRLGVLERDGERTLRLPAAGGSGLLVLVVESRGRINYGPHTGESKGILAGVRIGRRFAHGWTHRVIPQEAPETAGGPGTDAASAGGLGTDAASAGGLAEAVFDVATPADAWLAFPGGENGMVWLNGFLLGRYRAVGPQVTLYAPGPLWVAGRNVIRILDTDALGSAVEIREEPDFGRREEFVGS